MPYWVFQGRQATIAETYCVSRGIAGNSCQGSCFLKHSLEQQEREHGQSPLIQLQENELVFIEAQAMFTASESFCDRPMPPQRNEMVLEQMAIHPDTPPPWLRVRLS